MSTTAKNERSRPGTALPTGPGPVPIGRLRRARAGRRVAIALLAAFVAAGVGGVFGYRTEAVEASGGGFVLRLSYPVVGRPGMPIQWILRVHRDGGLPIEVTIATSVGYLDLLDLNAVEPEPVATTTTADHVLWTFTAPEGEDMTIVLDALVSANAHRGARAVTALLEKRRAGRAVGLRDPGGALRWRSSSARPSCGCSSWWSSVRSGARSCRSSARSNSSCWS